MTFYITRQRRLLLFTLNCTYSLLLRTFSNSECKWKAQKLLRCHPIISNCVPTKKSNFADFDKHEEFGIDNGFQIPNSRSVNYAPPPFRYSIRRNFGQVGTYLPLLHPALETCMKSLIGFTHIQISQPTRYSIPPMNFFLAITLGEAKDLWECLEGTPFPHRTGSHSLVPKHKYPNAGEEYIKQT